MPGNIPTTPIGGGNLRGVPDVKLAPTVTAEDFGGGRNLRDWANLGAAVQNAGQAHGLWAARKKEEQSQAKARTDAATYQDETNLAKKELFKRRSEAGINVSEELKKTSASIAEKLRKGMDSRAKTLFNEQILGIDVSNNNEAYHHESRNLEVFKAESFERKRAAAKLEASEYSSDPNKVLDSFDNIRQINAEQYAGSDPEYIAMKNRQDIAATIDVVAANVAEREGADKAVAFLNDPDVKSYFTDAEFKKTFGGMMEKYKNQAAEQIAVNSAIAISESGGDQDTKRKELYKFLVKEYGPKAADAAFATWGKLDSFDKEAREEAKAEAREAAKEAKAEAKEAAKEAKQAQKDSFKRREAARNDKLDREAHMDGRDGPPEGMSYDEWEKSQFDSLPFKRAKIAVDAYQAKEREKARAQTAVAAQRVIMLDKEFDAASGNITRMPSFASMTSKEKLSYGDLARDIKEQNGRPRKADESYYLRAKFDMTDTELGEIFSDPKKRASLASRLGGIGSREYKAIEARVVDIAKGKKTETKEDKFTSIDNALNALKNDAASMQVITGDPKRDGSINMIIKSAREDFESAMARHKVDSVEALPLGERSEIIAKALISYNIEGDAMTAAEARTRGIDVTSADVIEKSLPEKERKNLLPVGEARLDSDGSWVQERIPMEYAPEKVVVRARDVFGTISRDLNTGMWIVNSNNRSALAMLFHPNGEEAGEVKPEKTTTQVAEKLPEFQTMNDAYAEASSAARKATTDAMAMRNKDRKNREPIIYTFE